MSMYDLLSDGNGAIRASALVELLGIEDVGRMRDAWVEADADGNPVIAIFTRNGGGNRDCWEEAWANDGDDLSTANSDKCGCVGCVQTYVLPAHPLYLRDEDDDFDCTYCTNYFSAPPEHAEALKAVMRPHRNPVDEMMTAVRAMTAKKGGEA